ncbi:deoxyribonuclease IV [Erysipelothrix rhusiopathiae]|uniref:Probable endonuclease 4 n=1 Tax=Erysipelothrix rhusiopathiae ATCC 19414 TaxID=525280 RepID=E7FXF5_ERYRH|nr:deoxyribonuclease IV [Erysipelothrix rhusiopathiae]UPU39873.1 deoxyribonuclease IV [Erysipelothrix sp. Poltava]EFY08179.1 apurinic endonuclease (APN1) [Erysipelothrix rhusiopathiae ATCC 19414]MDE8339472.1 deoxyribonuclease IV [Erysipelothrix rhusiopathiae]MDV7680525.1 deoxyribonuclease IV [Erysipelothrix rhusiopathiae]VEH84006.1 Probable endonuclease 4 [Erysipelothrix rhusiopathiae]
MFYLGCHLSFAKGYEAMGHESLRIDANTFQFFTRSPRGGKAKPLNLEDLGKLNTLIEANNFKHILAHAPYTMNPCSNKDYTRDYAEELMRDDLSRMSHIKGSLYNFHPGSHVGQGVEPAIVMISDMLNRVLNSDQETIVLLETMAGKGTEVGRTFEEIAAIIEKVNVKEKIGVCWDTCHIYDAGYDIVNDLDGVIEHFDEVVGLDKLHAIHINDSKNPFKSHKDRHEKIGQGSIGLETFEKIINHPKLRHLPFYLETPQDDNDGYKAEIELLRSIRK